MTAILNRRKSMTAFSHHFYKVKAIRLLLSLWLNSSPESPPAMSLTRSHSSMQSSESLRKFQAKK